MVSFCFTLQITIRINLDYGEGVHMSRSLGEWSNMIGYKVVFFTGHGLHYGQDFFIGKLQVGMKKWHGY